MRPCLNEHCRSESAIRRGRILCVLAASACLALPSLGQEPRATAARLADLEASLGAAMEQGVNLLAPRHFETAAQLYAEADRAAARGDTAQVDALVGLAASALASANQAAEVVRSALREPLDARRAMVAARGGATPGSARAAGLLRDAAAHIEAGDAADGDALAREATAAYLKVAAMSLHLGTLRDVQRQIRARWAEADAELRRARKTASSVRHALRAAGTAADLRAAEERLQWLVDLLYPRFYREPPTVLHLDGFTLYVESYEARAWDAAQQQIVSATGIAWTSFACGPKIKLTGPTVGITTVARDLHVVEVVRDPSSEVEAAAARLLDPSATVGGSLRVQIPEYAKSSKQIAQALADAVAATLKPKGDIRVRFENLTIRQGAAINEGIVVAGSAHYPTAPPRPDVVALGIAGFVLRLSAFTLSVSGAIATGELEFPVSIVAPGTGHPGRVPLSNFAITPECAFRQNLPGQAFGPWSIGNTEMQIQGLGVVADFDRTWVPPGTPSSSAAADPTWRGVILDGGGTLGTSEAITSNSGYLRARYDFMAAEVTGPGLRGQFTLAAPFTFTALQPHGYEVFLSKGFLQLDRSAVASGSFENDQLAAPIPAAWTDTGDRVVAIYSGLDVDAALNLSGIATVKRPIRWGAYAAHTPTDFFEVRDVKYGRFYLAGTYRTNYSPVDASGAFVDPDLLIGTFVPRGVQGLSLYFPAKFTVFTPDTPTRSPLAFTSAGNIDRQTANWLNISFDGVHGRISNMIAPDPDGPGTTDLGPTYQPFYVGGAPFKIGEWVVPEVKEPRRQYWIAMQFAASASYASDMRGAFHIPDPVNGELEFTDMVFTSTAQDAGAKIPFKNPFKLSYWGLDMVKKPGTSSAGVLSVRTGQVLFTAAGIQELRHFAQPFYLIWGELLAKGELRRLVFDYNSAGQKFDRFGYTTAFVKLSDYTPGVPAYLKTAGTAHIDFFGPQYLNLHDIYDTDPARAGDPYNARRIELAADADPAGPYAPTDTTLAGDWSGGFGQLAFDLVYDDKVQDGFRGIGTMGFPWIGGALASSIVVKAERTCMSANDTDHHDFTLGPVAHFGAMHRITGCGCIEGGRLERIMLSAELEQQANANVALRSASYGSIEWSLTPAVSDLTIAGDMYLTVLAGGNVEVTGQARFVVNRAQEFVEGEVNGTIDTGTALGLGSVSADGQLNWHLGTFGGDAYQSLQGKVAVAVVSPLAGGAAEGGFYIGFNAPKSEAWVLAGAGDKFRLDMNPLPDRLTGAYGYARASSSINVYIFSGGVEGFCGLGGFVLSPQQVIDLHATSGGVGIGLPFVIGHTGIHVWGEILGGLVGASGWADMDVIVPYPFSYEGTLGLEGCALWVACASVDVSVGLNSSDGLFVR